MGYALLCPPLPALQFLPWDSILICPPGSEGLVEVPRAPEVHTVG